ncbi:hypothetical protein CI109_107305 [Kwoniella shandongensis]|uniref:Prenyltransferase alpha-alpha toroid domain-containing protein n=1 Tax=Kwoniella shandongensis TaxID=1734106 RepID=A0AAJ8N1G9_9TREE
MTDHPPAQQQTFKRNAHINYFLRCLRALPTAAQSSDSNRITAAYFCLSALDLLDALFEKTTPEQRSGWIEWIWSLQSGKYATKGGFRGSTFMTTSNEDTSPSHLPSTYTALLSLAILRAPLDRLNVPGLVSFLRSCQASDGSFSPLPGDDVYPSEGFQSDARMVYIASVISSIIGDLSGIDVTRACTFIQRCQTWEGAYASRPGVVEAQGGTTYCAVAAVSLLNGSIVAEDATLRWLIGRQLGGFQGRPGKLEDILDHDVINREADRSFLLSAQSPLGGFGKEPEDYPDPFHSYLALAALSLSHSQSELKPLDARWNISVETKEWLVREFGRTKHIQ